MKPPLSPTRLLAAAFAVGCTLVLAARDNADDGQLSTLKTLSLEELTNVEVTALSRTHERWWRMPGAVSVITAEEIRRSGASSLPDVLRLGAGVHVAQPSERSWAVGVRGFNVLAGNKVAVLLDGRSLYTPLYSGVQWDAQDTMLEDIDRIEIARGPVGSLWGTYAVNGFIQIFTKPAWDTQGALVTLGTGTHDPLILSARFGGRIGGRTYYRFYAKYFQADWTTDQSGTELQEATDFFQTGFRVDSLYPDDATLTVQGDFYTNKGLPLERLQADIDGANLLGRWRRFVPNGGELTFEGYLDYTSRVIPFNFSEERRTASVSGKFRTSAGAHDWLLGVDAMISKDEIGEFGFVGLSPSRETFHHVGLFVQDTVHVRPDVLRVTAGVKLEHNFYTGLEISPTLRLAYTPDERTTWWGAISRAVRTPVRLDRGLYARFGDISFFEPNSDYDSEYIHAFELGWRKHVSPTLALDVATFYNDYDNLRSNEPIGDAPFPRTFRNTLNARSHGAELSAIYQPTPHFLLRGSYRYLDLSFGREPGSRDVTRGDSEGNDPRHLLSLQAHLTLPGEFEFDAHFRSVSALPNPATPAYSTLNLRLGWRPSSRWELSVTGNNLLEKTHRELITTNSLNEWVPRTLTFKATWRY